MKLRLYRKVSERAFVNAEEFSKVRTENGNYNLELTRLLDDTVPGEYVLQFLVTTDGKWEWHDVPKVIEPMCEW